MLYNHPLAVALFALGTVIVLVISARRLKRLYSDDDFLDEAERTGLLSPTMREVWNQKRREFVIPLIGILLFIGWLLYVVDQAIR